MLKLSFKGDYESVDLTPQRLRIGRDKENDIVLDDDGISGFHAEFHNEEGNLFLEDLDSTNGTFVNGERIKGRQPIKAWDTVRFESIEAEVVDTEQSRPTVMKKAIGDEGQMDATATWSLIGISEPVPEKVFPLADKIVVGRDPSCEIVIDAETVSSRHAELELSGSTLSLRDLDSSNGTFVNGEKVTEATLKPGDEIKFDIVAMRVQGPEPDIKKTEVRPAVGVAETKVREAVGPAGTQLRSAVSDSEAAEAGVKLVVTEGKVSVTSFPLKGPGMTIGRIDDNDIALDDDTVSSRHAELSFSDGAWTIKDLGSSNGVFINGEKVDSGPLKPGDELGIGMIRLRLESAAGMAATQLVSSQDQATRVVPPSQAEKKGGSGWVFGVLGFVIAGLAVAGFFIYKNMDSRETEAKLQGRTLWEQNLSNGRVGPSTPVLADINGDKFLDVIVADASGFVLALDGQEGKQIFEAEAVDRILAPPVTKDLTGDGVDDLVVASNSGIVAALNAKGKTLWESSGKLNLGKIINRPVFHELNDDGVADIVLPTADKGLVALDGSRGWEIWNTQEMTVGKVITSPVKADVNEDGIMDFVAATDKGHVLAATSQKSKVWQIWETKIPEILYASPLYIKAEGQGLIVLATNGEGVHALNARTGRMTWVADVKKKFFASPVSVHANSDKFPDVALVAFNGDIHVLDGKTGDEIWKNAVGASVQASPALFDVNNDGLLDLIILDTSGNLKIFDMGRGRQILNVAVRDSDGFLASPIMGDVNNDKLLDIVTASQNGKISVYGINRSAPEGKALWPVFLGNDYHGVQ
jgi:pSer/pThr/pTyr-binding forkhead associated (FHA) protein